jgi:serine/threonine protein kinase
MAPEIIANKDYSEKVDVWSIGVLTYYILCGIEPFFASHTNELYQKIKVADYKYNGKALRN